MKEEERAERLKAKVEGERRGESKWCKVKVKR